MRGLYVGDDMRTFALAARLSQQVNFDLLERPLKKALVYLDPLEFKSTWLGNKAVYRTRMAMADGGELIILAPGLKEFGEDPAIDRLIRKFGYRGTPATLAAVKASAELRDNLSAAAHLIHGSSEGRFRITYCPGPQLSPETIRAVGFDAADLKTALDRYCPHQLHEGYNRLPDGDGVVLYQQPRARPVGAQKPIRTRCQMTSEEFTILSFLQQKPRRLLFAERDCPSRSAPTGL